MGKDWIEYQCKAGQTLFVYNKETGEHKWVLELPEVGLVCKTIGRHKNFLPIVQILVIDKNDDR